jgi:hypothetical protein
MILYHKLKNFDTALEGVFLNEILSTRSIWFTAVNNPDGSLTFVKDKPDGKFYMARLTKFKNLSAKITELFPTANQNNSYVTKCLPGYHMVPHKDANRQTALIIPLGTNKGKLSYYLFGQKILTHTYTGPLLSRVDVDHSAENDSEDIRYSITLELPGTYLSNLIKLINQ